MPSAPLIERWERRVQWPEAACGHFPGIIECQSPPGFCFPLRSVCPLPPSIWCDSFLCSLPCLVTASGNFTMPHCKPHWNSALTQISIPLGASVYNDLGYCLVFISSHHKDSSKQHTSSWFWKNLSFVVFCWFLSICLLASFSRLKITWYATALLAASGLLLSACP